MRSVVATGEHRGDPSLSYSAFSMGLTVSRSGAESDEQDTHMHVSGPMRLSEDSNMYSEISP